MRRELLALACLLGLSGCDGGSEASASPDGARSYKVAVAPPAACAHGTSCSVQVKLTALGSYKVNKDYPFRYVPAAGTQAGTGSFALDDTHSGTLTIRFSPAAAGKARLQGVFKLSVCSDESCHIEDAPIALDVPVT
jgi:hypothetical protein